MYRFTPIAVLFIFLSLIANCGNDNGRSILVSQPTTGSIRGVVSPINAYDAKVTLLQNAEIIAIVGVEDGIFEIDNLSPGRYDLRVSALGYVTNDAITGVQVSGGEITDVGRAVIFPEPTGEFVPTRITGIARDALTGAPIAQASIQVECAEGICGILDGVSDSEGRFAIAVWANLASIVTVEKEGYQSARIEVIGIPTGKSQSIEVVLKSLRR